VSDATTKVQNDNVTLAYRHLEELRGFINHRIAYQIMPAANAKYQKAWKYLALALKQFCDTDGHLGENPSGTHATLARVINNNPQPQRMIPLVEIGDAAGALAPKFFDAVDQFMNQLADVFDIPPREEEEEEDEEDEGAD
jgi:hypothetical protein